MKLRPYQQELAFKCAGKLGEHKICYLAMEVRTGKTLTSLAAAELIGASNVLFLTKKKAIKSIESDYNNFGFEFNLKVINNESMHKVSGDFDLLISDEHHRNAAYPKPNQSTKFIKEHWGRLPMIFLSGTPFPESYSQVFHSYWVSDHSPFSHTNFYKWVKDYVNVKQIRKAGGMLSNDYSDADWEKIRPQIEHTLLTFTQKEAGFTSDVVEHFIPVEMKSSTYRIMRLLKRDKVVQGKGGVILADTDIKLMQKCHQISSGTCKLEGGEGVILDDTKARQIKKIFNGKKIGIFYKFKAEWDCIKQVFGDDVTNNLEEFNETDKSIALQIVSGREGISLKEADCIVYFNIDFSAVSYWQSRDRLTTMDRLVNDVYWVFSTEGIESKVYKAVSAKKDFTLSLFRRDINN